jgi:hypothetical protein
MRQLTQEQAQGLLSLCLFIRNEMLHRGARRISLVVSWPPLRSVFARYGFTVSETKMAQFALRTAGYGFTMVLVL